MDMFGPFPSSMHMPGDPRGWRGGDAADCKSAYASHDFLTHDQRTGDARELGFDDLDPRERSIFLRCGFHAPMAA